MSEKVITVYDSSKTEIVGLIIVEEIELGYIKDKMIVFSTNEVKDLLFEFLDSLEKRYISIRDFNKKAVAEVLGIEKTRFLNFLEEFELKSKNLNNSSRYTRMLKTMELSHFERWDYKCH